MKLQATKKLLPDSLTGFRFLSLPQETQLKILEHTDLVTPSRHAIWDPQRKFHLPPGQKKGSWQAPTALFLVNRWVCQMAREVFWTRNHFETYVHSQSLYGYTKPGGPSTLPKRFSASEFLNGTVPIKFLRNIPSLDLRWFGIVEEENTENATEDWFRVLGDIKTYGGIHLDFLHIDNYRYVDPSKAVWEGSSNDSIIQSVRAFINSHLWPLPGYNTPPAFTRHLLVRLKSDTAELTYSIRQKSQKISTSYYNSELGNSHASQLFSWHWSEDMKNERSWYNEAQEGDWCETVWIKMRSPRLEY